MAADPEGTLRRREFLGRTAAAAGAASLASLLPAEQLIAAAAQKQGKRGKLPSPRELPIDTFVVLMMENRSLRPLLRLAPGRRREEHRASATPTSTATRSRPTT